MYVWNAQGARSNKGGFITEKWEEIWRRRLAPILGPVYPPPGPAPAGPAAAPQADNVAFLICEAGWAPWIGRDAQLAENGRYMLDEDLTNVDHVAAGASDFCAGVASARRRCAFFVPWVKTLDSARQSARCSFGGMYAPDPTAARTWRLLTKVDRLVDGAFVRPVVCLEVGVGFGNGLAMLLVHLVSSRNAQAELEQLLTNVEKIYPASRGPVMIVGDMNIDLLVGPALRIPAGWHILNSGSATHTGGKELDWALLRDPNNSFRTRSAVISDPPDQPGAPSWNVSDHAVMHYTVRM